MMLLKPWAQEEVGSSCDCNIELGVDEMKAVDSFQLSTVFWLVLVSIINKKKSNC